MTKITCQDIKKLSRLSRIAIDSSQEEQLANQVEQVIKWVDNLSGLDSSGVEPMNNPQDIVLRMEKDEISDGKIAEKILKNAPKEIYGYFAVPKVIE